MSKRNKVHAVIIVFLWLILMTIYRGIDLNWTDGRLFSFIAVGLLDTLIILLQAGTSILSWNMLNNLFKKTP